MMMMMLFSTMLKVKYKVISEMCSNDFKVTLFLAPLPHSQESEEPSN